MIEPSLRFLVYGFIGGEPARYQTLHEAEQRARRAALENPGSEFFIHEIVVGVRTAAPEPHTWDWREPRG